MSYSNNDEVSGRKKGFNDFVKIGLMAAVAIWIFTIANEAKNLAMEHEYLLNEPKYQVSYVAGGPQRFKDKFKEAFDTNKQKIKAEGYLWSTLIVENTGNSDAQDIEIEDHAAIDIAKIGVAEPGYGYNEVNTDYNQKDKKATINLQELPTDTKVYVFIAMEPKEIKKPYNQESHRVWSQVYDSYQEKVVVSSYGSEDTVYYSGSSNLYD